MCGALIGHLFPKAFGRPVLSGIDTEELHVNLASCWWDLLRYQISFDMIVILVYFFHESKNHCSFSVL